MASAASARLERLGQVVFQPVAVAVDDALRQPPVDRPVAVVLRRPGVGLDALEQRQQLLQRVVVVGAAVVDEVEADLLGPVVDPGQREDLGGVHDRRVETRLHALVQEHRVEHLAGRRVEPEGDVGQPEDGGHAGQLRLDPPDALDGLDPVLAALLHAGRQRQGQRVEEQVLGRQAVALDGDVADVAGRPQLPLRGAGLALLVDAGADDGGPELAGEPQERVEACPGPSPSSRLTELRIGRPPSHSSAARTTGPSVESTMSGTLAWVQKRLAISFMSATPSAPV